MDANENLLASWAGEVQFERHKLLRRLVKTALVNPAANYLPAGLVRMALRLAKSELAAANWADPGGWRSMVISYNGRTRQVADRILVGTGTIPMALRNRRRLAARIITGLIDLCSGPQVHVLCLGAGPGHVITDALTRCTRDARATLVDLSSDAFEYGRRLATEHNIAHRVRFIQGDVRNGLDKMLGEPVDIIKMLGICEYLTDEQIVGIVRVAAGVCPPGAAIVFNSLSNAHGTDRFFRRVFGLHMTHRSPQHLQELIGSAGFDQFAAAAEPLGVYHVIVGRRQS